MPTIYINGEKHTPSSGTIAKMERAGTMPAYSRDPPSGSGGSLGASGSGNRTQQKPVKAPAKTPAKAPAKAPARPAASVPTPRPRPATPAAPAVTTKPRWGAPAPKVPARPAGGGVTVVKKNPAANLSAIPGSPFVSPIRQPFLTGASPGHFNQNQSKGVEAARSAAERAAATMREKQSGKSAGKMGGSFAKGGAVKKFAAGGRVEGNNIIGSKTKRKYRIGDHFQTGAYEYEAMADGTFKRGKRVGAKAAAPAKVVTTKAKVTSPSNGTRKSTTRTSTKIVPPIPKTRPAAKPSTGFVAPAKTQEYNRMGYAKGRSPTEAFAQPKQKFGPPTKEQAAPRPKQRSVALRNKQNTAAGKETTNATGGKRYVGPFEAERQRKNRNGRKTGGGF